MTAASSLGILGAGRMGHAIAETLIRRRVMAAGSIWMADPSLPARRRAGTLRCHVVSDPAEAAAHVNDILLAVKPQKILDLADEIRPVVRGKRLISILAGTTLSRLRRLFPRTCVIRVMPNTPLQVGSGAIVVATNGLNGRDRRFVKKLFSPMGRIFFVPEKWMNAVTALSGSGPALYCAFLESCAAAAGRHGLPADLSEDLAVQTLEGTGRLLSGLRLTPAALREMVTSPGGTTEAALGVFRRRGLNRIADAAIGAAVKRSAALSR